MEGTGLGSQVVKDIESMVVESRASIVSFNSTPAFPGSYRVWGAQRWDSTEVEPKPAGAFTMGSPANEPDRNFWPTLMRRAIGASIAISP